MSFLVLFVVIFHIRLTDVIYVGDECLQQCPPYFEHMTFSDPNKPEVPSFFATFMEEVLEQKPKCVFNIASYMKVAAIPDTGDIDLVEYHKTISSDDPSSPYYCFGDIKDKTDPRMTLLEIQSELCYKYDNFVVGCNLEWPCVYNAIREVCNYRGVYNCSSASCVCFDGFIAGTNLDAPEDDFVSCDMDIRSFFNETIIQIPEDFIANGKFESQLIEVTELLKLPELVTIRWYSQAYMLGEFHDAINNPDIEPDVKNDYLRYLNVSEEDEPKVNGTDALFIGIHTSYLDWDVDEGGISSNIFKDSAQEDSQPLPFKPYIKNIRTNRPNYFALTEHGVYQINEQYWLVNDTEIKPVKASNIGYVCTIKAKWYSTELFVTFISAGQIKINWELSNILEISSKDIVWFNINDEGSGTVPILYKCKLIIKSAHESVIDNFENQYKTTTEFDSIYFRNNNRAVTVLSRKYGGIIYASIVRPQKHDNSQWTHNNITNALINVFERTIGVDKEQINLVYSEDAENIFITIFEEKSSLTGKDFKQLKARLKDEPDPYNDYKPEKEFSSILDVELQSLKTDLKIDNIGESWQVIDGEKSPVYAALYEIIIFGTEVEIATQTTPSEADIDEFLDEFKYALFNGTQSTLDVTDDDINGQINGKDIMEIWYKSPEFASKYTADIKIIADSVESLDVYQQSAIQSLKTATSTSGYGYLDEPPTTVTTTINVYAAIFVESTKSNLLDIEWITGGSKATVLNQVLTQLIFPAGDVTVLIETINVDIDTLKGEIMIEFSLETNMLDEAKTIIEKIKSTKFPDEINQKLFDFEQSWTVNAVLIKSTSTLTNLKDDAQQTAVEVKSFGNELRPNDTNTTDTLTELFEAFTLKYVNTHWRFVLPYEIFCSPFYTALTFGTSITFAMIEQWLCIRINNIIFGVGAIKIESELIYKPKQPGSPDGLTELCDYWEKKQNNEVESDPEKDAQLEEAGEGVDKVCLLLAAGKSLLPDNLPPTVPDPQKALSSELKVKDLPAVILKDSRLNPKYPNKEDLFSIRGPELESVNNEFTNDTNTTDTSDDDIIPIATNEDEGLPADAYVIMAGVAVGIIFMMYRRQMKKRKEKKKLLEEDDEYDPVTGLKKVKRLTAADYKDIYNKARQNISDMDFSKLKKKEKRVFEWTELEKKEAKLKGKEKLIDKYKEYRANNNDDDQATDEGFKASFIVEDEDTELSDF